MTRGSGHDPLAALRVPAFRLFTVSRIGSGVASTLLQAVIAWQVYGISGSALQLGMIGLARFVPALAMSLIGGAVADAYNRRTIILLSQTVPLACTFLVLWAIAGNAVTLLLLYAIVLLTGLASAFENPARQAILPQIVPRAIFTNAITMNSTLQSIAFISGPAVAGGLIATVGVGAVYVVHGVLVAIAIVVLVPVRVPEGGGRRAVGIDAVREGVSYVRHRPVLLGAMTLDMFAVIFGGAKALLPVYAVDIMEVGAVGYGVLTSALEAGALLMALLLIVFPPPRQTGRTLILSVAAFGLATVIFGFSREFWLSVVAYMAVGAADQLSVVMRHATIQLSTPDTLRGRVSSVNAVFISTSNQLGSVESGVVAALTTATFSVVSGGLGCLAVVALVWWRIPQLRSYRADAPAPDEAAAERDAAAAGGS
ncbi:MAG: MFS transporter [Chloroflexi bacterium]|nr:MFS transporter [Chloroflexota bacterium]